MKKNLHKERKKKRRQDRIRRQKRHEKARLSQALKETPEPPPWEAEDENVEMDSPPLPKLPSMYASERFHRTIARLAKEQEFQSEDEFKEFLTGIMGQDLDKITKDLKADPVEQAQELAYQAMEEDDPKEGLALAKRALELDPDCVDALAVVAGTSTRSLGEAIPKLQLAVETGRRALGEEFFEENRGHFWGIIETRPYMRAHASLARLFQLAGQMEEAIRHYEELLELNPNDNQGVRDTLLACYLMMNNLEGARKLFEQYDESTFAVFAWGRVLERFLAGELEEAKKALRQARKKNRYVASYLAGRRRVPRVGPSSYSPGEMSEAVYCAVELGRAWARHPAAVEWLQSSIKR